MNFIGYDIIFLVVFLIFISAFLYFNRKNLKKEGLLFLYKTTWGMKQIDKIGKRYQKTLKFLSYISITMGYLLMVSMLYLLGKIIYLYVTYPSIVRAIKVPPITPLIPYLPQMFKLDFLPPFYFTYWIIILALIAITHEFAHGILMKRYGVRIKSTGFGFFPFFLPIFLAAFVEQDEKSMIKSSKFNQMAILSAGTFANVLTAIFFFVIMWLFFTVSFVPAGAQFNTYSYSIVAISGISSINNISLENATYLQLLNFSNEDGLNKIEYQGKTYLMNKIGLEEQKGTSNLLILYEDAPAINANLEGAIVSVNNIKINGWEEFGEQISNFSPGENITIKTIIDDEVKNYEITLGESPDNPEEPYVGVGYAEQKRSGLLGKVVETLSSFKKQYIYYEPKFEAAEFLYDLLWWIVLISISVALVNMLPMGIFDGGRFFYLTILGLTKSKKKAEKWFKISTNFLLFLLIVLMILWAISWIK
ncbi:MAG: site-2 protease family protein [Candidatus Diapherotrites archaeon]